MRLLLILSFLLICSVTFSQTLPDANVWGNTLLKAKTANGDSLGWVKVSQLQSANSRLTWNIGGNSGTTAGTNFVGTTDAQDLVFKRHNVERMRISSTGIGINKSSGIEYPLDIGGQVRLVGGFVHGTSWADGTSLNVYNGYTNYITFKPTGTQFNTYLGVNGESGSSTYPLLVGCSYTDGTGLYVAGFKKGNGSIAASIESTGNFYASGTGRFAGTGSGSVNDSIATLDATNTLRKRRLADLFTPATQNLHEFESVGAFFGEVGSVSNELKNSLWKADKRFTVGGKGMPGHFDGELYSSPISILAGDSITITTPLQSYMASKFYICYYSNNVPSTAPTIVVVDGSGNRTTAPTPSNISITAGYVVHKFVSTAFTQNKIVVIFPSACQPSEIVQFIDIAEDLFTKEVPYFSKFNALNRYYGSLNFNTTGQNINHNINAQGNSYFAAQTGNIGIGTASPTYKLDVNGTAKATNMILTGLGSGASTDSLVTADGSGNLRKRKVSDVIPSSNGWSLSGDYNTVAGTNYLGTADAVDLVIKTNNSERIRATAGGNVGIGVTYPTSKLHVYGDAYVQNSASNSKAFYAYQSGSGTVYGSYNQTESTVSTNAYGSYSLSNGVNNGTNIGGYFAATNSATNYALITGGGNVGINTSSPTYKFHVIGNSMVQNVSDNGIAHYSSQAGGTGTIYGQYSHANSTVSTNAYGSYNVSTGVNSGTNIGGYFSATSATTNYALITGSGNVGINTSSPTATFDVNGSVRFRTGGVNGYIAVSDGAGNLTWTSPSSITTAAPATPSLAATAAVSNSTNTSLNFPYGSGIASGTSEVYSVWGQSRFRYGINIGSSPDQYSGGNLTSTISGYGAVNLVTGDSTRLRVASNGNVGINNINPSERLSVTGNGTFTGTVVGADATAATHLLNRQTGDTRYLLQGGNNISGDLYYGTISNYDLYMKRGNSIRLGVYVNAMTFSNSSFAEFQTSTPDQANLQLNNTTTNTIGKVYVNPQINSIVSTANNGDLIYSPNSAELSMRVNAKRKDFAFGTNAKQIFNTNTVDGNDSCFVTITDTTKTLRVTNTLGATSKARINLPQNPQNDMRITVVVKGAPTSIDFRIVSGTTGQSIVTSYAFTPTVGDVYEIWFDSSSEGSSTGEYYIKKL